MKKILLSLFLCFFFTQIIFAKDPVFVNSYEQAIESEKNVLLVFSTDWCGYCSKLKKDFNKLDFSDYVVCVIDAEKDVVISKKYKINSYPTSVILNNKKEVSRKTGYSKDYNFWLEKNR